jgi:formylglycine-generating enzyme required for sulfatase activity
VPWSEEDLLQDFYFYPPRLKWNAKDGLEYILVPKGSFQMGCVPADNQCLADEKPRHTVTLPNDIWLGRTEVTVASYKLFSDATKRQMPAPIASVNDAWRDGNHPIVKISWNDANAFCQWSGGRLPTEAEWEYSTRGGQEGRIYGESVESKWRFTRPVAESASNSFGLLGMTENAEEWVADWYGEHAYERVGVVDPQGPQSGRERVVRGGSWAGQRRLSARLGSSPDMATSSRGFRCVFTAAGTTGSEPEK